MPTVNNNANCGCNVYRWVKVVETACRQPWRDNVQNNTGGGNKCKQGKGQVQGQVNRPAATQANAGHGAGLAGGHTAGTSGFSRPPPARHSGLPVCYAYNQMAGCARKAQGSNACVDPMSSIVYAHVCNWYFKGVGGQQGRYCLTPHPRNGNH